MITTTTINIENEILSLNEVKNYLRTDHTSDDELIKNLIKTARETIEKFLNKSIALHTYKMTVDREKFTYLTFEDLHKPMFFDGVIRMPLSRPPIVKILKFEINKRTIQPIDFKVEELNSSTFLTTSLKLSEAEASEISIEYKAGFKEIPYQIKLAALMLVANVYESRFSSDMLVFNRNIKNLLTPFMRLAVS